MRKTPLILMAAALPMAVNAANTEFSYGGFIKFDAMYSQYDDGAVANNSLGRDFYVPSQTPTAASGANLDSNSYLDMHAKTSRFNFKTNTDFGDGVTASSFIELDFFGDTASGNEVVSNSYQPRLRHAFVKTGHLLVGQTWTTFMNTDALPEMVDFLGVSDGAVFIRQPQVRYTSGNLQFSLENANTTGATNGTSGSIPDMVARYNIKSGKHAFSVAAIARQFSDIADTNSDGKNDIDESATGFGVSVSGKVMVGEDDLKFSLTTGNVGRYVGVAAAADVTKNAKGKLEPTMVTAAYIAYRHHWNSKMRSTVAYSMLSADYDAKNTGDTDTSSNVRVNLMYSPVKKLSYGVELSQAKHELDAATKTEGTLSRLQFTTKYAF